MVYETRSDETEDERLADRLTERPAARAGRIARRDVNPETADALRRLWEN